MWKAALKHHDVEDDSGDAITDQENHFIEFSGIVAILDIGQRSHVGIDPRIRLMLVKLRHRLRLTRSRYLLFREDGLCMVEIFFGSGYLGLASSLANTIEGPSIDTIGRTSQKPYTLSLSYTFAHLQTSDIADPRTSAHNHLHLNGQCPLGQVSGLVGVKQPQSDMRHVTCFTKRPEKIGWPTSSGL